MKSKKWTLEISYLYDENFDEAFLALLRAKLKFYLITNPPLGGSLRPGKKIQGAERYSKGCQTGTHTVE